MSGFMSATVSGLTVYQIDNVAALSTSKLRQFAFQPIDKLPEPKGWGWTNIDNMFDTAWRDSAPEKGSFLCFALRVDTRKISPAVLKKHLGEALREEEAKAQAEGFKVSRARKKELKELHTQKLLSGAEPVPMSVDVALNTDTGLLYVGTNSTTMLELLEGQMLLSFDITPTRLTLAGLEERSDLDDQNVELFLRSVYESAVSVDCEDRTCTLSNAGEATLTQEDGSAVTVKNADMCANAGLEAGLAFQKLKLNLEREGNVWELTLHANFSFSSLKTPKAEQQNDGEPDAALLEKLYLMTQAVHVVHAAFRQYCA